MRILSLLAFLTACHSYDILDPKERPLLSFFVGPMHIPACLLNCTTKFQVELMSFVTGNVSMQSRNKICGLYEDASVCVREHCSDYEILYRKLTSGFNWACDSADPFESLFKCIVVMGKQAREEKNCGTFCNVPTNALMSFESADNLISGMNDFCGPLACYMNCTREQMNSYCPTSGSKLIHVAASAFDELIYEIQHTTPSERHEIMRQVPKSCKLFFNHKMVTAFRFDEKFVYDLFFMITSRKQRVKNGKLDNTEAVRIVRDLISKMENEEKPKKPVTWTKQNIMTVIFMGFVLLLNIIGLAFTVYWCLNMNNEGVASTNNPNLEIDHFLEPQIRMKVKFPRLRADAIKDSYQDVLEMRVPRNGNQGGLDDEQTTVVVPRDKYRRRRTFSVPIEQTHNRNSTGSDKFPQVVVLRNHHEL
ncbi:unnamed protein product [Caenorhabditis angaria]|uniref:Chondroitin proteoglycan 4 domain-containing protein n=1 Tax=Caenorhabditis angaria TaxID=860376 RepID=A0A9P1I6J0_9PELO|nr:unnamed protein product [Caenorhabditis angaria]